MDMGEAVRRLEESIATRRQAIDSIDRTMERFRTQLAELESQRATLIAVMELLKSEDDEKQGRGAEEAILDDLLPEVSEADRWQQMTRLEAVYQVMLAEGQPMHLADIAIELHRRHRDDSVDLISAALSSLRRRGQVASEGRGVWRAIPQSNSQGELENLLSSGHSPDNPLVSRITHTESWVES